MHHLQHRWPSRLRPRHRLTQSPQQQLNHKQRCTMFSLVTFLCAVANRTCNSAVRAKGRPSKTASAGRVTCELLLPWLAFFLRRSTPPIRAHEHSPPSPNPALPLVFFFRPYLVAAATAGIRLICSWQRYQQHGRDCCCIKLSVYTLVHSGKAGHGKRLAAAASRAWVR